MEDFVKFFTTCTHAEFMSYASLYRLGEMPQEMADGWREFRRIETQRIQRQNDEALRHVKQQIRDSA